MSSAENPMCSPCNEEETIEDAPIVTETSGESESSATNSHDTSNTKNIFRSKRKKLTFAAMAVIFFTGSAAYSIMSPFFPNEAAEKGCSKTLVGLIFGVYPLTVFLMSPVVGLLLPAVGPRFTLFAGLFLEGGTNLLFGFVSLMPSGTLFIVFCFFIRTIQAFGTAASQTAMFTIIAGEFHESISLVLGFNEIFTGSGMMLGPPLGGVLYEAGGFKLPFLLLGACVLLSLPVSYNLLPPTTQRSEDGEEQSKGSVIKLAFVPGIFILSLTIFVGGCFLGFLDPTLSPFLKNTYNFDATKIGLVFFLISITYTVVSPLFGWIADRANKRLLIILGLFLTALSYILVGPWPVLVEYFNFPRKSQYLMLPSFGMVGASIALGLVPIMGDMLDTARREGYPDDISTHGLISGLFNSMFAMGSFVGPSFGSILAAKYKFPTAASIFAAIVAGQAVIVMIFTIADHCARRTVQIIRRRRSTSASMNNELLDPDLFDHECA